MSAPKEISVQEARELLDSDSSAYFYDVREPWEILTASVEKIVPIDETTVKELLESGDREATYVFMCHHGVRSLDAAAFFAHHGFEKTYSMAGGIDAWSVEIDPGVARY